MFCLCNCADVIPRPESDSQRQAQLLEDGGAGDQAQFRCLCKKGRPFELSVFYCLNRKTPGTASPSVIAYQLFQDGAGSEPVEPHCPLPLPDGTASGPFSTKHI